MLCIRRFLFKFGHRQVTISIFECVGESKWGTEPNHRPEIIPHKADIEVADSTVEPVPRGPAGLPPNSTAVLTNLNDGC
jgi:hypothetical protein